MNLNGTPINLANFSICALISFITRWMAEDEAEREEMTVVLVRCGVSSADRVARASSRVGH